MPVLPALSGRQVVPDHREVAKGTLRSLVRAAGLTVEAFMAEAERI